MIPKLIYCLDHSTDVQDYNLLCLSICFTGNLRWTHLNHPLKFWMTPLTPLPEPAVTEKAAPGQCFLLYFPPQFHSPLHFISNIPESLLFTTAVDVKAASSFISPKLLLSSLILLPFMPYKILLRHKADHNALIIRIVFFHLLNWYQEL